MGRHVAPAQLNCVSAMGTLCICIVDLGATHVLAAIFTRGPQHTLVLERLETELIDSEPAAGSRWTANARAGLERIAARLRWSGRMRLAVPGHLALTKVVRTPAIEKSRRAGVIRFEAAQNIPYPLGEVAWDHVVLGAQERELELLFGAAKLAPLEALCAAPLILRADLELATPSCLALVRAVRFNHPDLADGTLLANVGARSTHLLLLAGGRLWVRTIALGGNSLTEAIAEQLQTGFARAETLKIDVLAGRSELPGDSPARGAVNAAAGAFARRLRTEIARSIANFQSRHGAPPPVSLHLSGGGTLIPALPGVLAETLHVPVARFDPLRRVANQVSAGAPAATAPGLAEAVGLAADLVSTGEDSLNLLPPAVRDAAIARRRRPVFLAAAAAVVFAVLAPAWRHHRIAGLAQAERAAAERELQPLRLDAQRMAAMRARLETLQAETVALQQLAEQRSSWLRFLGDMERRLVEVQDVWLDEMRVAPPQATADRTGVQDAEPLRIAVSGRMLDPAPAGADGSVEAPERVKRLLIALAESPFVSAVQSERFDRSVRGVLRFELTLLAKPASQL